MSRWVGPVAETVLWAGDDVHGFAGFWKIWRDWRRTAARSFLRPYGWPFQDVSELMVFPDAVKAIWMAV